MREIFGPMMASCVLRRAVIAGLRRINAVRGPAQLNKPSERLICSSAYLLQKYFTEKHEWVDIPEGQDIGTVGITDYAQEEARVKGFYDTHNHLDKKCKILGKDKLGDVVFIQLPDMGQVLEADGEAGVLESVKAASDIFSPVSGEVTELNNNVTENPEIINKDPYGEGWLYKMKISDPSELEELMSEDGYNDFLKTQD